MKRGYWRVGWLAILLIALTPSAWAHLGSKDVFETVDAGPYKLFVTIRPPNVIPGVATVEVRVSGAAATGVQITPIPLTGEAAKHPPSADQMKVSTLDPNFYTGGVWMMQSGSWQVRFGVDGVAGHQTASVPVPAIALGTLKMGRGMGWGLAALGVFLVVSMAGTVAAAVREARLAPGVAPDAGRRQRGWAAMAAALLVMGLMVWGGAKWWNVEAATYAGNVYQPMKTVASLNGDVLDLTVQGVMRDPKVTRVPSQSNRDFLPDHGHLMHLYAIRQPEMDAVFHLHPELAGAGDFRMSLPTMPAGDYTLYGDIVHANGFPETLVAKVNVPADKPAQPLGPDDAEALPQPISKGELGASYRLPDGYTMIWDKPATLTATTPYLFHFRLVAPDGQPAGDMRPYMGMAGHAAFVKTDGTVFAHTHPEGSAAMAALDMANGSMAGMAMPTGPDVEFPYGFPTPGAYRIFIQMKHGETIETGVFDAQVK